MGRAICLIALSAATTTLVRIIRPRVQPLRRARVKENSKEPSSAEEPGPHKSNGNPLLVLAPLSVLSAKSGRPEFMGTRSRLLRIGKLWVDNCASIKVAVGVIVMGLFGRCSALSLLLRVEG